METTVMQVRGGTPVTLVKDKGAPVLTPVKRSAVLQLDDAGAGFGAEHD